MKRSVLLHELLRAAQHALHREAVESASITLAAAHAIIEAERAHLGHAPVEEGLYLELVSQLADQLHGEELAL